MYYPLFEKLKFLPEHKQVLHHLIIDENNPGPILHDFDVTLNFFRESKQTLTASYQLPLRVVTAINPRLSHPIQLGLKRPQQRSYPHIHGLYLLLRASGLTYVDTTGKNPVLIVDELVRQQWATLNPVERYGSLLETWFLRGKSEILGERERRWLIPDNFQEAAWFYTKIPPDGLAVTGNRDVEEWLMHSPGWHNLGLMDLFGLIRVQPGAPEPGKSWRIEHVYRTPAGDALLTALYAGFFENYENLTRLENEGKVPFGVFQPVLQPYLTAWKNSLTMPEWAFREGAYIFKVSLGPVRCRIAIGAKSPLDSLASIILEAVNFDSDHLYQFSYRNRFGVMQDINHPYLEDGPFTSEVRVGDVPLAIGGTMTYLFDFGDNWEFDVTLEQVDPDKTLKKPAILETQGEPPEQYPRWDEDEDE